MSEELINFLTDVFKSNILQIFIGTLTFVIGLSFFWFYRRKEAAKKVLEGYTIKNLKNPQKIFNRHFFVKPYFINNDKKILTLRDIQKYITKDNINKKRVLVIHSEAGLGKTRLIQFIAYKLMVKNLFKLLFIKKWIESNDVFFRRLCRYNAIDDVISEIKAKKYKFILLDGFDEFKPVKDNEPDKLLKTLFDEISKLPDTFSKIIITSRIELLNKEENLKNADVTILNNMGMIVENTEYVKIKRLNNKQIIKLYKSNNKINKSDKFLERNNLKKLKIYLRKAGENNVFRNSFFAINANAIINEFSIDEANSLTNEKILNVIVSNSLKKEKALFEINYSKIESFETILLSVLDKVALTMLRNESNILSLNRQTVKNEDMQELTKYINTRALLVRSNNYLEFIHRMIFEYFVARNIQKMEYKQRRDILSNHKLYENTSRFYAFFLYKKDGTLKYSIKDLLMNIQTFNNVIQLSDSYNSVLDLVKAKNAVINDNADLKTNELIHILPLLEEVSYLGYKNVSVKKYIELSTLDLNNRGLTALEKIEMFGDFKSINLISNNITDFGRLNNYRHLNELKISISTAQHLEQIENIDVDSLFILADNYEQFISYSPNDNLHKKIQDVKIRINFDYIKKKDNIVKLYSKLYFLIKQKSVSFEKGETLLDNKTISSIVIDFLHENKKDVINIIKILESIYYIHLRLGFKDDYVKEKLIFNIIYYIYYHRSFLAKNNQQVDETNEAIKDYSKIISYIPNLSSKFFKVFISAAYNDRALCYNKINEYANAIKDFEKAIEQEPQNVDIYINMAKSYIRQKDYNGVLKSMKKVMELEPQNAVYIKTFEKIREKIAVPEKIIDIEEFKLNDGYYYKTHNDLIKRLELNDITYKTIN